MRYVRSVTVSVRVWLKEIVIKYTSSYNMVICVLHAMTIFIG